MKQLHRNLWEALIALTILVTLTVAAGGDTYDVVIDPDLRGDPEEPASSAFCGTPSTTHNTDSEIPQNDSRKQVSRSVAHEIFGDDIL
jgi:hypothetical protein